MEDDTGRSKDARSIAASIGLLLYGLGGPFAGSLMEPGVMNRATSDGAFWLLLATFFVCGPTSNGLVGQHFISHVSDHGFDEVTAAN